MIVVCAFSYIASHIIHTMSLEIFYLKLHFFVPATKEQCMYKVIRGNLRKILFECYVLSCWKMHVILIWKQMRTSKYVYKEYKSSMPRLEQFS